MQTKKAYTAPDDKITPSEASLNVIMPYMNLTFSAFMSFLMYYTDNVFLVIVFSYVLVPLLDMLMPPDASNVSSENIKVFEKDWRFNIPLLGASLVDLTVYTYVIAGVANGTRAETLSSFAINVLSAAVIGSSSMVVGHELAHRRHKIMRLIGYLIHMKCLCGHVPIAHQDIHHKYTGIPGIDQGLVPRGKSAASKFEFLFI